MPTAPPSFVDDAEAVGLKFVLDHGRSLERQLPETMAGGVGLLDYDGDGWLDVYVVQGRSLSAPDQPPPVRRPPVPQQPRRHFEDVSKAAGITDFAGGYGHGVAVGDYDNDGRPDLFVTRWRSYALYRNRGGTFEDVTETAGLGGDRDWPTSAAWADLDGDGDLDLYVCHYLDWNAESPQLCRDATNQAYQYCNPRSFTARADHLFRNDGGRFVDVTGTPASSTVMAEGSGSSPPTSIETVLSISSWPTTRRPISCSETEAACASRRWEWPPARPPMPTVDTRREWAWRAVIWTATDSPTWSSPTSMANRRPSFGIWAVGISVTGRPPSASRVPSRYRLGFGVAMLDVDNDGRLDLATANGHVEDFRPLIPYAMPAQLLVAAENGRLVDVSDSAGAPWRVPRVGRGLAAGDLDNDGRVDLVLVGQGEPLAYLHNRSAAGHFLTLRLEGTTSNRDAVGARVAVVAAGRRREAERIGGGSYQSASDPRLHFGLGPNLRVESVEVRWPSGRVDRYRDLKADGCYLLREGQVEPELMKGWPGSE